MDLIQIGVQLLQSKFGDNVQAGDLTSALSDLLGGENGLDVASLLSKMQGNGGLASMVTSWLGDGDNEAISGGQVRELFGSDKVAEFASKINVDEDTAVSGLAEMLPQMIDKSSAGGSMLDAVGGVDGLMGMAGKLFK